MPDFESNKFGYKTVIGIISLTAVAAWYTAGVLFSINWKLDKNSQDVVALTQAVGKFTQQQEEIDKIKSNRWNFYMEIEFDAELQAKNPNLIVPDAKRIHDELSQ